MSDEPCKTCGGTGRVQTAVETSLGLKLEWTTCGKCKGSGEA